VKFCSCCNSFILSISARDFVSYRTRALRENLVGGVGGDGGKWGRGLSQGKDCSQGGSP
jgi:hypothetical protein